MGIDLEFQQKFDCSTCSTPCDSRSKSKYVFKDDVEISEEAEDWVLNHLVFSLGLNAKKTKPEAHGLPDIEIYKNQEVVCRIEVKAQGRAFMSISRLLPGSDLLPYETVALNLSDLERYIALQKSDTLPTFIIWRVKRPCLGEGYWGNNLKALEKLLSKYSTKRRFRRASTKSDYVDGEHKGVTVNYHFSLKELLELEDFMKEIQLQFQA